MSRYAPVPTEAAINQSYYTQQDTNRPPMPVKPPFAVNRLYQNTPTKAALMRALETDFSTYGISSQLGIAIQTITNESSWNILAYNPKAWRVGGSYGIAQFTPPTFKENCSGAYRNPYDQLACMAKLWAKNQQWRWDGYP